MGSRYHVGIDGRGYLVKPGSYRRGSAGQSGGEWERWQQVDWRRGDGQRVQGEPGAWWSGYGVRIGTAGRLALGEALASSYASAEGGYAALVAFGSKLYAASSSGGNVHEFNGSTWSLSANTLKSSLRCLATWGPGLYVGSGSDGEGQSTTGGGSWGTAFTAAAAAAVAALAGYMVWDPVALATAPRLFAGVEYSTGEGRVFTWDGASLVEVHRVREAGISAMVVYQGRLYVATNGNGGGRVLVFDGRSSGGGWAEVLRISGDYVAGWCEFEGLLYCGGSAGRVYAFDGDRLVEAFDLVERGVSAPGVLRGLAVADGRLFVGFNHGTLGGALASKLPAAVVLDPVLAVAGGSGRAELDACRLGWHTPSGSGAAGAVRSVGVYAGKLYLARDAAGAATIYVRDPAVFRTSGQAETAELVARGLEGLLLRRVEIRHTALLSGESVAVYAGLDTGPTFQAGERFDSLAGCDGALTTADWRTADGLVRAKGMPAQTFGGKVRGSWVAVRHLGWRVETADPLLPPALAGRVGPWGMPPAVPEVQEIAQASYDAIGAAGGAVAALSTAVAGEYQHVVFRFSLGELAPYGLKPRAVAYGLGDNAGAAAPGVVFRMWNHQTRAWDLVGSNVAAAGDSEAARTIWAEVVANMPYYLSANGEVFVGLRSSYAGTSGNPSTVGLDFVGLDLLWDDAAEAVSGPVAVPVSATISQATLTVVAGATPVGTTRTLYLSADGGGHWEVVTSAVLHTFAYAGTDLRWKVGLLSDTTATATVEELRVSYSTGAWILLGTSNVAGSVARWFEFGAGARARRVSLRLVLGSGSTSAGPAVTGVVLEYGRSASSRRRWVFEVRCEGADGLPLRLLDGALEPVSGADLSRALWAAREREVVELEDVDGRVYRAWFQGVSEVLGELPQGRGAQTVARCELVEC